MQLLQTFVTADDLSEALIPTDSIDFHPTKSPVVGAGGGGRIFKCTSIQTVNSRLKLKQTVRAGWCCHLLGAIVAAAVGNVIVTAIAKFMTQVVSYLLLLPTGGAERDLCNARLYDG